MSFTFATSGAIINRAGKNASTTATSSGSIIQQFSDDAEAYVNAVTEFDWVAASAAIGVNYLNMLRTAVSCTAAIDLISYDMSGFTSRGEAEDMVNILNDRKEKAIRFLVDDKKKTAMGVS